MLECRCGLRRSDRLDAVPFGIPVASENNVLQAGRAFPPCIWGNTGGIRRRSIAYGEQPCVEGSRQTLSRQAGKISCAIPCDFAKNRKITKQERPFECRGFDDRQAKPFTARSEENAACVQVGLF